MESSAVFYACVMNGGEFLAFISFFIKTGRGPV